MCGHAHPELTHTCTCMQAEPVKDGWNRQKVQRDVLETARLQKFTSEQVADWQALFDFHERYKTPESLPNLPHTIHIEAGRSYTMEGPPTWEELWRVLRRYPRPHRNADDPAAAAAREAARAAAAAHDDRESTAAQAAAVTAAAQQMTQAEKTAALNRVGGLNHQMSEHRAAQAHKKVLNEISEVGREVKSVELNTLYFCAITESEGELQVGIAVPRTVASEENFNCEWFVRAKWSAKHGHKDYNWQANPIFIPCLHQEAQQQATKKAKKGRKGGAKYKTVVVTSVEPRQEFIPVKVGVFFV
jgi:hypothetical protein